jgi:hypothetical protein
VLPVALAADTDGIDGGRQRYAWSRPTQARG